MKKIILLFYVFISQVVSSQEINLGFFYLESSHRLNNTEIKDLADFIKQQQPDIILLANISGIEELNKLRIHFQEFKFASIVNGEDKTSHLAVISKIKPEIFQAITDQKYNIKNNIELPVKRGFLYMLIKKNGYMLHVLSAHLKSREKHPIYNQTDMRRYEARLLRQNVNKIMKVEPEANILILGNMNDSCGKSPIKAIYNRRFGVAKRLFDLRPLDEMNVSWTSLSRQRDEYERLDYAMASSSLIPEIMFDINRIINKKSWTRFFSHRPIIISISCIERSLWAKENLDSIFPYAIRTPEYISPPIGAKRKRGSD